MLVGQAGKRLCSGRRRFTAWVVPTHMDVFVYGTLTEPEQVAAIVDSYAFLGSAVLTGLHPVQGEYPTLAPGGKTGGRLLRTDDIDALDAHESVSDGLYTRLSVPIRRTESGASGDETAEIADNASVYVGDPTRLGVGGDVVWPDVETTGARVDAGTFSERVRAYVQQHAVRVLVA